MCRKGQKKAQRIPFLIYCPTSEAGVAKELESLQQTGFVGDSLHFVRRFAPTSSAVTDSLDFRVADAPLQIQFASAKCVRCARRQATEEQHQFYYSKYGPILRASPI